MQEHSGRLTARDLSLLQALDYAPLTSKQILELSETFAYPFTTERKVRQRLQEHLAGGRVHRWPYTAIAGRGGTPNYYTLSRLGYQLLYGADAAPSRKRAFRPIGLSHQQHTYALAEFLMHTLVCANRAGIRLTGFCRENTVQLKDGADTVYPDAAFQLLPQDGSRYSFFVELDNGTERIHTDKDTESWERKIRVYEAVQDRFAQRFRVLVIGTRSTERIEHILAMAARLAGNPQRSLFYGITLEAYQQESEPMTKPCFRDHRGDSVSLVPRPTPFLSSLPQAMAAVISSPAC